jgi:hypothetical protein
MDCGGEPEGGGFDWVDAAYQISKTTPATIGIAIQPRFCDEGLAG